MFVRLDMEWINRSVLWLSCRKRVVELLVETIEWMETKKKKKENWSISYNSGGSADKK